MNETIEQRKRREKRRPNGYVLVDRPISHSRPVHCKSLVAVGSNIYKIGGATEDELSSNVSILDCTSNAWREGPSMRVERRYPAIIALDGKIYVAGGCKDCVSSNWMEVFDPKTLTWESPSSRKTKICGPFIHKSVVDEVSTMGIGHKCKLFCVIENVLYRYFMGDFMWYDTKISHWRYIMSVKGLPRVAKCNVRMVDYDGKMAVFWDRIVTSNGDKKNMIWCAVIELERGDSGEIWGKVQWQDIVLSVPLSYNVYVALAPIL